MPMIDGRYVSDDGGYVVTTLDRGVETDEPANAENTARLLRSLHDERKTMTGSHAISCAIDIDIDDSVAPSIRAHGGRAAWRAAYDNLSEWIAQVHALRKRMGWDR